MTEPTESDKRHTELEAALKRASEWMRTATPEQKAAMYKAQRESWVRGMAPCEHGDPDWETCPECNKRAMEWKP